MLNMGLSDRQVKPVFFVKEKGKICNKEYQGMNNISDRNALRDLENLIVINVLLKRVKKRNHL